MAPPKKNALTDAELSAMLEAIGEDGSSTSTTQRPTPTTSNTNTANDNEHDEDDPLAELKNLAAARNASSRPGTPRVGNSSSTTSTRTRSPAGARNPEAYTPTTGSGRSSEEKATLETDPAVAQVKAPGGSWWGGLSAMANAAVKQAEAAVKEIQKNEEAQKWAEQMKGNYGALRGFGGQLSSRALPTFTNILHTLAPPISQHERLQIHITHDLVNYPSLDPLVYQVFSRVMAQVEGGDLMTIQRGSESGQRREGEGYTGSALGSSGWNDGNWWRADNVERQLGPIKGIVEATKLARVSAESYSAEFFAARGGVEEAAKQATTTLSESNPVRSSDIFLAIQAVTHEANKEWFAQSAAPKESTTVVEDAVSEDQVSFAVYIHDPVHSIAFGTLSQAMPQKWADWIDAKSTYSTHDGAKLVPQLPDEILEIIESDGVDPREWIAEWIEEAISLAVGIVAQRYVARRMGVGEGGIGRGKRPESMVESGAGEAARAL